MYLGQIQKLNQGAKRNQELNNEVLAEWFRQSALYFQKLQETVNKTLDEMELYRELDYHRPTEEERFRAYWYILEEENPDSFSLE